MLLYTFLQWCFAIIILSGLVSSLPVTTNTSYCDQVVTQEHSICCKDMHILNPGVCALMRRKNRLSSPYHYIICMNMTDDSLQKSLQEYSLWKCDLPVRIYLPELDFMLDTETFDSVAANLNSLTIKSWNPYPIHVDTDKMPISKMIKPYNLEGSPFKHLSRLKVLDIAFCGSATFSQLSQHFFDGLENLESLHIENLPPGASIAKGAFLDSPSKSSLKCLGLLTSTIPCSCKVDDPGHWLHHWMHRHKHTWTAEGKDKVKYTDEETSDGAFFLCEVKVKCLMDIEEFNGTQREDPGGLKLEVPFHHFHWPTRCRTTTANPTTTVVTTEAVAVPKEPCQTRSERSTDGSEPSNMNPHETLCPSRDTTQDGEARRLMEDEPKPEAVMSSGTTMIHEIWISVVLSGFLHFWNRNL